MGSGTALASLRGRKVGTVNNGSYGSDKVAHGSRARLRDRDVGTGMGKAGLPKSRVPKNRVPKKQGPKNRVSKKRGCQNGGCQKPGVLKLGLLKNVL